jgi:FtsZ-binding cell division protein ZapB
LLTLLKQGRAYGLGVLLATQNPVDLDYKGLSNTGTWFIGRLQTERDKARVLDGLEGAAAASAGSFDRKQMDTIMSGLGNRVFLINNVHDDGPELFQTRKALSNLTGPMSLEQVKQLRKGMKKDAPAAAPVAEAPRVEKPSSATPLLPPDIKTCYLPIRTVRPESSSLLYAPRVLAIGNVKFADTKYGVDTTLQYCLLGTISGDIEGLTWDKAQPAKVWMEDLVTQAENGAEFGQLPSAMSNPKSYATWSKEFATWLYAAKSVKVYKSELTGEFSKPRENERDFRIRLAQSAREKRDESKAELQAKYAPKLASLKEKEARLTQALQREQAEAQQQQLNAAVNVGATMLGAFMGRRGGNIGRASTAARTMARTAKEQQDVQHASDNLQRIREQQGELDRTFQQEMSALEGKFDPANLELSEVTIAPKKANITVPFIALAWAPFWRLQTGEMRPAWIRTES